jgi:hypothetical protein
LTVWTIQFDKKKRLYNRQVYAGIRSIPRVSSIETCSTSLGDIDPCNLLKVQKQEKDQGQKEKKKKNSRNVVIVSLRRSQLAQVPNPYLIRAPSATSVWPVASETPLGKPLLTGNPSP